MNIKTVSKKTTYELTPEQIRELIAEKLGVKDQSKVQVSFVIQEVGGDPHDERYTGTPTVVAIKAVVDNT